MPVLVYHGEEAYLLERAVRALRQKIVPPGMEAFSYRRLVQPSLPDVIEAVGAVSLNLGGAMLIEIRQFGPLTKATTDTALIEQLMDVLKAADDTRQVLFAQEKIDRKLKLTKALLGLPGVAQQEFKALAFWQTAEAAQLLIHTAEAEGMPITPPAAVLLVEAYGIRLQPLLNEVTKLHVYTGGAPIQPEHVNQLADHNENTFQMLSDWVCNRHRDRVVKTLDELLLRQHPVQLFALIQTYLNNVFSLRFWRDLGLSEAQMAERTKKHPYRIKKDLQEFSGVPIKRLHQLKEQALDLEYRSKTGGLPDRLALEMLLGM